MLNRVQYIFIYNKFFTIDFDVSIFWQPAEIWLTTLVS